MSMRLNKYIAAGSNLSRRGADEAIAQNRVLVNGTLPSSGQQVSPGDIVTLDNTVITTAVNTLTVMFNKPAGYVCSREGQGSRTVYDLLAPEYQQLQTVGRLDKESSGLLLLTNDGDLAHRLTHPSFQKTKVYEITLDKPLQPLHRQMISDIGITLDDGRSQLELERLKEGDDTAWRIRMHEGRNRQIRRTFAAVGYDVIKLHRTAFGAYDLGDLKQGQVIKVEGTE